MHDNHYMFNFLFYFSFLDPQLKFPHKISENHGVGGGGGGTPKLMATTCVCVCVCVCVGGGVLQKLRNVDKWGGGGGGVNILQN